MQNETIADALFLYREYLQKVNSDNAEDVYNLTVTSLSRYTLPAWGYPAPQGRKPTKVEKAAVDEVFTSTNIKKLVHALVDQEKVFETVGATDQQKYTYRSKLKSFITWLKQQGLLHKGRKVRTNHAPRMNHGNGTSTVKRVTNKNKLPDYGLKRDQAPANLVAEIEKFSDFMTKTRYPGRQVDPVKPSVAKGYIKILYRILGWFLTSGRVDSIDALSLENLVPKVILKRAKNKEEALEQAQKAARYLDEWICEFLDFLEGERGVSANGLMSSISPINILVKYQHNSESEDKDFRDIPAMAVIRRHLNEIREKQKTQKPVIDNSAKWLNLPEILTKVVEPLRLECAYRINNHGVRTDNAIAASFQRFLMLGFLTFIPPRRQQEWRDLKISSSCLLTDKPKNLTSGQFIHPLPADRDKEKFYGYLYKDVDGKWYKDTPPESYKTGDTYGYQKLEIPNNVFKEDGKSLYDYLEAFLYGYFRDSKGNWVSGGKKINGDVTLKNGKWHNLRMSFEPAHNFFFMQSKKGYPLTEKDFAYIIRAAAHRLTGQLLTPHLLRDIYATWFLDNGYTESQIESLAYAMGHSVRVLRQIYDDRNHEQKTRPINEEMELIFDNLINNNSPVKASKKGNQHKVVGVEKLQKDQDRLEKLLSMLTPEQLAELALG
jgi:integrase